MFAFGNIPHRSVNPGRSSSAVNGLWFPIPALRLTEKVT
jgi:hypothetical protein